MRKLKSTNQKLENFYDSLIDDILEGSIEVDKETTRRAARIARTVPDLVANARRRTESDEKLNAQRIWNLMQNSSSVESGVTPEVKKVESEGKEI